MMLYPLMTYLLNSVWQVPLLTAAAWLGLALLRPSPRTRHRVWVLALLLAALLPLAGTLRATPPPQGMRLATASPSPATLELPPGHSIALSPPAARLIVFDYLLTIVIALLRLALAHRAVERMRRSSHPYPLAPAQAAAIDGIARRLQVSAPQIRIHASAGQTPMLAGIRQPILLWPRELECCTDTEFQAVVAHELAHLARRDLLTSLLLSCVSAPVAYHPCTSVIVRNIRRTRELLADSLAATLSASPASYANALLSLTRLLVLHPPAPAATVNLFPPSHRAARQLEERIMTLLAPPRSSRPFARIVRVAVSLLVLAGGLAAASCFRLLPPVEASASNVQIATTPPPAPATPAPPPMAPIAPQPPAAPAPPTGRTTRQHRAAEDSAAAPPAADVPTAAPAQAYEFDRPDVALSFPNAKEMQKQLDAATANLRTPEFQAQMQKLAADGREMALEMSRNRASWESFNDPAFQQQMRELTQHSAEMAREAARQALPPQAFTMYLTSPAQRRETARQLDAASASLDQAIKKTHDPAIVEKLNEAKAALDKARAHD